jgi:hypothetical protein
MYVYRNFLFLNNGLSYSLPHDFPRLCDVDAMPHDGCHVVLARCNNDMSEV